MRDLPVLLRLPDGTTCEYRKRGVHWECRCDGRGWLPVLGDHGAEFMEAALDEIVRISGESSGYRERWIHADARLQTKEPT